MSNNLLDLWEGDQRDWRQVVKGISASEGHHYVENLRRRVQKHKTRDVQNRRSSHVLTSKRGSRASAEQRRRPHITDYRIWLATVEIRRFSQFRIWLWRRGSCVSEKKHSPRVAERRVWEAKSQKCKPVGLRVAVYIYGLRTSDATQKRRGLKPRILYLLNR